MTSSAETDATAVEINIDGADGPQAGRVAPSQADANNHNISYNRLHSSTANYGAMDTAGVTRILPSTVPGYRPLVNQDGAHVIHITDGGHIIPDINVYQQKKSLAQGMMDLALLSANANQLRYVLESCQHHPFFYVNLVLLTSSIFIQVAVGFGLIWKSQYNMNNENEFHAANRISNLVSIGIFVITLVNVMLSAFSIAEISKS